MLQEKILVAPFFVARIDFVAEGFAGGFAVRVPVVHVFLETVIGREVEAAAEPPDRASRLALGAAKKRTFMWRWARRDSQGCSTSDTPRARQARPASSGRWAVAEGGRIFAVHFGEVDAGLLE